MTTWLLLLTLAAVSLGEPVLRLNKPGVRRGKDIIIGTISPPATPSSRSSSRRTGRPPEWRT